MTPSENDPATQTNILIADDDRLVRTGIAAILESAPDMRITAQATDGREAIQAATTHRLDVAL